MKFQKMRGRCLRIIGLGALMVLVGCQPQLSDVAFRAADAVVVVNSQTAKTPSGKKWVKAAARDLTNVLAKVTGVVVPVYDEGSEPKDAKAVIYLGETEAARAAGLADANQRRGDWRIRTEKGKAYLYAKSGVGATSAVVDFAARQLDYHFLLMDGNDPYVRDPARTVRVSDVTVRPALYMREIYTAMWNREKWPTTSGRRMAWQRHLHGDRTDELEPEFRLSNRPSTVQCHTIFDYLPPERFFKDHPEWYSMGLDGQRRGVRNAESQICYTNPEAREEIYRALLRCIAADRAEHPTDYPCLYDMSQMDNTTSLCHCPACAKVIAKYNRVPGGYREGGDAGLQLEFYNDLARRVRKDYPDVQIRMFAYVSSERAPKPGTIAVEPNLRIWWCDLYSTCDHTLPLETPGHYNGEHLRNLREWMDLTHNIQIWDYAYSVGFGFYPEVLADAVAADAKLYASTGLPVLNMETEYCEQAFYELNCYLMGQLYVDPTQDVDALVRRFCRVYGKGAADMEEAISFLRKIERENPAANAADWHARILPWLTRANMERFAAIVQRAYDKESDPVFRSRILGPLSTAWRQLVSILKKDPRAKEAFAKAQANYRRYAKEWYATGFFEEGDRAKKQQAVDAAIEVLTLRFDDIPAELKGVPEDKLVYIDYHVKGAATPGRRDEMSSRGYFLSRTARDLNLKGGYPIACGVYDSQAKDGFAISLTAKELPPDGRYHWIRIGRAHLGRNSFFWFPWSWTAGAPLKEYHILADGAEKDPNWCEVWASMRVDGKLFNAKLSGADAIYLDRMILRRD